MALPSQTPRASNRHAYTYRRARNRPLRWVVMLALLFGAAWLAWEFLPRLTTAATKPGGEQIARTGEGDVVGVGMVPRASEERPMPPVHPTAADQRANRSTSPGAGQTATRDRTSSGDRGGTSDASSPPPMANHRPVEPATSVASVGDSTTRVPEANVPASPSPDRGSRGGTSFTLRAAQRLDQGLQLLASNRPVEAREMLSLALLSGELDPAQEDLVRVRLSELNERIVFGPEIATGDPFIQRYTIASGDSLSKVVKRLGLQIDWRFVQRINRISDPTKIWVGQNIKLITGPFHAVVDKSDYRMDLYLGEGEQRVFVTSLPVGLGELDSTPEGLFTIRENSKLVNPAWVNPRTRERYAANDPANPIGERWMGLRGLDDHLISVDGYGIHGTIEPESIGRQASMGCVRMHGEDVALVYEVLTEEVSTVLIRR